MDYFDKLKKEMGISEEEIIKARTTLRSKNLIIEGPYSVQTLRYVGGKWVVVQKTLSNN